MHHRVTHEHHHGRRQPLRARRQAASLLRDYIHNEEREDKHRDDLVTGTVVRHSAALRLRRVRVQPQDGRLLRQRRHV